MSRRFFGTDGVRGVANVEPMTPEFALKLGRAFGAVLRGPQDDHPSVILGRDTRQSGTMIESALAAGLNSSGVDARLAGVVPTPAVAMLTRTTSASAGIVVSASHNPFPDNGIKLFDGDGFKLPDEVESRIETLIDEGVDLRPTGAGVGCIRSIEDGLERYCDFVVSTAPALRLDGMRIVVDAANGAAHAIAPALFEGLGAEVIRVGVAPDGRNINEGCGATSVGAACATVRKVGAALGVVVDGDADRLMLVDGDGEVVDGDGYLGIMACALGRAAGPTVVGTVMTNMGLELMLRDRGVELVRTPVGDRYVLDEMRRRNAKLGGESSGHLILLDHGTTGDALLAAVQLLQVVVSTGRPLRELRETFTPLPQVLVNVRVARRCRLEELPETASAIEAVEAHLDGRGRVLVRFSGTEPLVRVMVEGEDESDVRQQAERIAAVVAEELSEGNVR